MTDTLENTSQKSHFIAITHCRWLAAVTLSRAMLSGSAKGALQKWIERPLCFAGEIIALHG